MPKKSISFPKDFIWGTAVASHQAEGHNVHSDWWRWEQEGKIYDGTVSGAAADMLNRYPEDFALMKKFGYNGFRLSTEWARIEPAQGEFSEEALDHYENVLRELKKRKIKVCLTLYHWVLPAWTADQGGWTNPRSVEWFAEYVRRVVERLHGLVDLWCTLNEPLCPVFANWLIGEFPPEKRDFFLAAKVFRNLLKAHAAAAEIIRETARARGGEDPMIGIAHAFIYFEPVNPRNPLDRAVHSAFDYLHNRTFPEAVHTGRVPLPFGAGEKIPGLAGSCNYVGVNYYMRMRLRVPPATIPKRMEDLLYHHEGMECSDMFPGYEIHPPGFHKTLMRATRFGLPLYVTENGCADAGDDLRRSYLLRHIAQVRRAMDDGADIRGYFQWSYIDNFEWRYGFEKKLGLIGLEPGTLNRLPKPSAHMYGEIAKTGKITREMVEKYAPGLRWDDFV